MSVDSYGVEQFHADGFIVVEDLLDLSELMIEKLFYITLLIFKLLYLSINFHLYWYEKWV